MAGHFRAHPRRPVRLTVELRVDREATPRAASLQDISLAGAGLSLDASQEPLAPGQRLTIAIATPALWDPLLVAAVVAWSQAASGREAARAGIAFEHAAPDSVFATWEMLSALVFD